MEEGTLQWALSLSKLHTYACTIRNALIAKNTEWLLKMCLHNQVRVTWRSPDSASKMKAPVRRRARGERKHSLNFNGALVRTVISY